MDISEDSYKTSSDNKNSINSERAFLVCMNDENYELILSSEYFPPKI